MRLLIIAPCTAQSGMGHYYRSLTLADTAYHLGHQVVFASDRLPEGRPYVTFHLPDKPIIRGYDWVVIDSPSEHPPLVTVDSGKVCLIDGLGHQNGGQADLVISQGLQGDYCAPDYLMLRPEVFKAVPSVQRGNSWLVWGGAADRLGLLPAFAVACPNEPAHLLRSDFGEDTPLKSSSVHWLTLVKEDDIFYWGRQCDRGAVAMGMIVWENLVMGLKVYVFSLTPRHLESALAMQARGWIRAYPEIGLPPPVVMREWLAVPFEPVWPDISVNGTKRVVKLLESKL